MHSASAASGEPPQLGDYLQAQLLAHGHVEPSAATCAAQLMRVSGPAATASLLVDIGTCHFLGGDLAGAIATWRQVISSDQPAPASRALFNLGLLYEDLERYEQSIAVLKSAIQHLVEPYLSAASMVIARCQVASGDDTAAMQTLAKLTQDLLAVKPEPAVLGDALLALGDAAAAAGRPDRADRAWRAAALSGSPSVRSLVDARLVTNEPIDHTPAPAPELDEPDPLHRVEQLAAEGRRQEAIDLLVTVPGASLAAVDRFRFAEMLLDYGLVNQAIDQLEVLLSAPVDEHQLRAAFILAELYRAHLMLPDAETMYLRVVDGADEVWSTRALVGLAEVLEEIGETSQAVLYWERAAMCSDPSIRSIAEERLATAVEPLDAPGPSDMTPAGVLHAVAPPSEPVIDGAAAAAGLVIEIGEDEPVIDLATRGEPVVVLLVPPSREADPGVPEVIAPEQAASPPVAVKPHTPVVISLRESAAAGRVIELDPKTAPRAEADHASVPADSPNPYAALAPDDLDVSVLPSTRNPYAELAPHFDGPIEVRELTEPSHWRSMLDDEWADEPRPGFFARNL